MRLTHHNLNQLLLLLRRLAVTEGGMRILARQARVPRTTLYRLLEKGRNPPSRTLLRILKAAGCRMEVRLPAAKKRRRP